MTLESTRGLTAQKACLLPDVGLDHFVPGAKHATWRANARGGVGSDREPDLFKDRHRQVRAPALRN